MAAPNIPPKPPLPPKPVVSSLLDAMVDGREYSSLLSVQPSNIELGTEIRRGIAEVEAARGRPLVCYVSNVLRAGDVGTTIELADDLPFAEIIAAVPADKMAIDLFVATPGGSGQQVNSFVNKLRPRFDFVGFVVPHMCMFAGTLWATAANEIVMDNRAFLGPIDPQVRNREGRFVPAQALFTLVADIQKQGQEALAKGQQPSWTNIQLLRLLDPKELGDALAATHYSVQLATDYLNKYKFASWTTRESSQIPVTAEYRLATAKKVAELLGSYNEWKAHSHGIFSDVLKEKCGLKITPPDATLARAMRRLWAVFYWVFENTDIQKIYISSSYSLFRSKPKLKQNNDKA